MAFDVKSIAEQAVKKIQADPKMLLEFKNDPIKVLENLSGIDIPDGQAEAVVNAVKAQMAVGGAADLAGKLGDLFKK